MAISAKTIKRWKEELQINERLLSTESERFHWLRSLYVRVYQFLLSRYDDEGLQSPTQEDDRGSDDGNHASTMPFVDLTLDHHGLPARTPQSLRYVLEQVQSNQPASASVNTSKKGRSISPEWVVVATSQDYRLSSCESVLKDRGIRFRKSAFGLYRALEVRFDDRSAAFAELRSHPRRVLRWSKRDRAAALHSWEFAQEFKRKFTLFLLFSILVTALIFFLIVIVTTWTLRLPAVESWLQFRAPPRFPSSRDADVGFRADTRAACRHVL